MAIVEKYVTTTGAGTNSGDDEANAYAWSHVNDAMTAGGSLTASAGWRFNIKAGTYSISSTDTFTVDGTTASPIIFRGYNSAIGDLDAQGRNSDGSLNTTNFPVLSYASATRLNATGSDNLIFQNLKVTVASTGFSGALLNLGVNNIAYRCYVDNISTNAAAVAIGMSNATISVIDCDAALTGASGGSGAIAISASVARVIGCRVVLSQAAGITSTSSTGHILIAFCTIANCGAGGIVYTSTTASTTFTLLCNTIDDITGDGFSHGNAAFTGVQVFIGNHVSDCSAYGFDCDYDGTGQLAGFFAFNRTRDNASGAINGFDDWASASTLEHVTTDTDDAGDFTAAGSNDYSLITAAPGKGTGFPRYADAGAMQRQETSAGGGGPIMGGMVVR